MEESLLPSVLTIEDGSLIPDEIPGETAYVSNNNQDTDGDAPEITNLSLSSTTDQASGQTLLSAQISISDDLSGLQSGYLNFSSPPTTSGVSGGGYGSQYVETQQAHLQVAVLPIFLECLFQLHLLQQVVKY